MYLIFKFWCKYICHLVEAQYSQNNEKKENGSICNVDKYTCRPSFVLCSELSATKSMKPSKFKRQTKPNTQTMKTINCVPAAIYMLTKLSILVSLHCLNSFTYCWAFAGSPLVVQCKKKKYIYIMLLVWWSVQKWPKPCFDKASKTM